MKTLQPNLHQYMTYVLTFLQASLKLDLKSIRLETLEWMFQVKILSLLSLIYRDIFSLIKSQAGA